MALILSTSDAITAESAQPAYLEELRQNAGVGVGVAAAVGRERDRAHVDDAAPVGGRQDSPQPRLPGAAVELVDLGRDGTVAEDVERIASAAQRMTWVCGPAPGSSSGGVPSSG